MTTTTNLIDPRLSADDVVELAANVPKLLAIIKAQAKQIEALQADAERYRWLRDVGDASFMALGKRPNVRFTHEIDTAIDAARKGNV